MNKFIRSAAMLAVLAIASAANASQSYDYSYTFASGDVVSGSFTGDASGNLVTNLSNITASLDGVALTGSGSLYTASYDLSTYTWTANAGVASFDGTQNNFLFIDVNYPLDYNFTNYYYSLSDYGQDFVSTSSGYAYNAASAGTWTLSAAVPEPANGALLFAGMGVMGLMLRRKNAQK